MREDAVGSDVRYVVSPGIVCTLGGRAFVREDQTDGPRETIFLQKGLVSFARGDDIDSHDLIEITEDVVRRSDTLRVHRGGPGVVITVYDSSDLEVMSVIFLEEARAPVPMASVLGSL